MSGRRCAKKTAAAAGTPPRRALGMLSNAQGGAVKQQLPASPQVARKSTLSGTPQRKAWGAENGMSVVAPLGSAADLAALFSMDVAASSVC
jgi:hypothetical protein